MKKLFIKKHSAIFWVVCAIIIFIVFLTSLSSVSSEKLSQDRAQLEKAIANAAVSCYAIEGAYPESIDYLIDNYGIQIDTERFTVKYELFASNLMPDITVLINQNEN